MATQPSLYQTRDDPGTCMQLSDSNLNGACANIKDLKGRQAFVRHEQDLYMHVAHLRAFLEHQGAVEVEQAK